jgi:hypothetical protein
MANISERNWFVRFFPKALGVIQSHTHSITGNPGWNHYMVKCLLAFSKGG